MRVGKIILDSFQPGGEILELGCATGNNGRQLAALGYRVRGLDTELPLTREFNRLSRLSGFSPAIASALVGNGERLPFPDNYFDGVIATEVLEHTERPERVVREIGRVLRPQGMLCLAVPTEASERLFAYLHPRWNTYSCHLQVFSRDRLLSLVRESGLTVLETRGENGEWSLFWTLFALLRADFDFTGTPTSHLLLYRAYWKLWRILGPTGLPAAVQSLSDRLFPKSLYIYAQKR